MTLQIGDLVRWRHRPEGRPWIVSVIEADGVIRMKRFEKGRLTAMLASSASVDLIARPVIEPGDRVVCHDGEEGIVVADLGTKVRISTHRRVALAGGGHLSLDGHTERDKASLVLDNLNRLPLVEP